MAEEIVLDIDIDKGGQGAKSLKQLKQEFREQQKELEGLTVGSKAYVEQLKRLGQIKDEIGDLNDEIKGLGSASGSFKAIGNVASGLAGGFAAATGAAALFGAESEELEKTMLRVQAALALSQGIEQVAQLGDAFKILKSIILANPIIALATVITGIVTSFVGLDNIIDGVKAGFDALAEGVSAAFDFIVEGVKYAIDLYTQYLDIVTFGLFDLNDAYKGYIKSIEDANEAERKRLQQLEEEKEALRETIAELSKRSKLLEKEIEIIEKQKAAVTRRYDDEIAFAKAAGKETFEIEQKKLTDLIEFTKKEIALKEEKFKIDIELQQKTQELSAKILGEEVLELTRRNSEYLKEQKKGNEERKKNIEQLTKDLANFERDLKVSTISEEKARNDAYREASEERLKIAEEEAKKRKDFEEKVNEELKAIDKIRGDDFLVGQQEVSDVWQSIWANNYDKFNQLSLASLEKEEENNKKDRELFEATQAAKVQMLSDTIMTLSAITDLFGKNNEKSAKRAFEINKTLSIADAVIKTYQSANAIFASAAANPATVLFPAQPFIAAGLAIAAGLTNVAKIAQTKFEGSQSTSAPSVQAPNLTTGGGAPQTGGGTEINTTLLDRQRIESGQNTQRVYVLESDITQTQNRVNTIISRATVE